MEEMRDRYEISVGGCCGLQHIMSRINLPLASYYENIEKRSLL
jgi:hypothetical protein